MKKVKPPVLVQNGPTGSGKKPDGKGPRGPPNENVPNENGQIEIQRMVNRHKKTNREHNEKQQAEAAVHHHFEESFKLAQQQRVCII